MSQQQFLFLLVPVTVGCLVGVVVLTVLAMRKRRSNHGLSPSRLARNDDWDEYEESYADRRSSVWRDGQPVKVVLTSPTLRSGRDDGYVLDRSTGGLRVAVRSEIPAGTVLQVRANNAPDTVPWVTIVVRSCRNSGPNFELGCEFDATPPWNVLLLFG